ncbi:triose-phosphate isomerase, partial [Mesorhizobium sp. B4-1-3]
MTQAPQVWIGTSWKMNIAATSDYADARQAEIVAVAEDVLGR